MKKYLGSYVKVTKLIYILDRRIYLHSFFLAFCETVQPFAGFWFIALLLNQLEDGQSFAKLAPTIVGFTLALLLLQLFIHYFSRKRNDTQEHMMKRLDQAVTKKLLMISYFQLQDQKMRDNYQRAKSGIRHTGGFYTFVNTLMTSIFSGGVALVLAATAFIQLGKAKTTADSSLAQWSNRPVYLLILLLCLIIPILLRLFISYLGNQLQKKSFNNSVSVNRQFSYYYGTMYKYQHGPAIRLFQMRPYFLQKLEKYAASSKQLIKIAAKAESLTALGAVIMAFFTAAIYGLILIKAYYGALAIGSVIMYVGYFTELSHSLSRILNQIISSNMIVTVLDFYYDFLNTVPESRGSLSIEKRDDNAYEIEFHDVSFKYPAAEEWALRHIFLKLTIGENLAIVGPNGSGKTTFIKLLCRLYPVTEGKITLNGIEIDKYDPVEYQKILAVVFQDFKLFAFSVAENIAADKNPDLIRVQQALHIAGIDERIAQMPKKTASVLYKNLDSKGVEVSGGEAQKIAIARAWYKDAPFVILDEPTSALDPFSEYEIYKRFDDLVQNKTAIYISHRMSSARFSERIVVFDGGQIKEIGNHANLMQKQGLYAKLFQAQAQYYSDAKDSENAAVFA